MELFTTLIGNSSRPTCAGKSTERLLTIGEVVNCSEYQDEQNRRAFLLEFSTADASKFVMIASMCARLTCCLYSRKALCMTGYNVAGVPL